ncbi:hypothetical protein EJ110_NYTH24200 [Nymphaea thermarum]|nr:hypothetical protein EJ110_NYTH24200 [Nymphaea thermarum]
MAKSARPFTVFLLVLLLVVTEATAASPNGRIIYPAIGKDDDPCVEGKCPIERPARPYRRGCDKETDCDRIEMRSNSSIDML